eukprot:Clim_evm92s236 gene=Clim_evmTU92s236
MILLEFHNRIIEDTLTEHCQERPDDQKYDRVEVGINDFDGVQFRIATSEDNNDRRSVLTVSMSYAPFAELDKYGASAKLKSVYGDLMLATPEQGYNITVKFDALTVPSDEQAKKDLIHNIALMKRHTMAGLFETFFKRQKAGTDLDSAAIIEYRPGEHMVVSAGSDKVVVVFSTRFRDEDDIIIGKVFLQEFVDARKTVHTAPQVLFNLKNPPDEIAQFSNKLPSGADLSYVTFVLFPRHFKDETADRTIDLIHTFRDYFHYHIKCSKAYLHTRMRARVASSLKVLTRAKPEGAGDRKTASGRTFSLKRK